MWFISEKVFLLIIKDYSNLVFMISHQHGEHKKIILVIAEKKILWQHIIIRLEKTMEKIDLNRQ